MVAAIPSIIAYLSKLPPSVLAGRARARPAAPMTRKSFASGGRLGERCVFPHAEHRAAKEPRSRNLLRHLRRARPPAEPHRAHRLREFHVLRPCCEAQGSVLTNKYAEGYPGRRWYGGCEFVDKVEQLAIDRAKRLFGAEHANVQPHSGSQANFAVYTSVLQPGDKILAMNLSHGGHLTHGNPANFSGQALQGRGLRRPRGQPADRLRPAGRGRAGGEAEDDHGRGERLLAGDRLRADGRDRPGLGRPPLRRHRPHRGPRRLRAPPLADPPRGLRDDDDAQDPARAARAASSSAGRRTPRRSTRPCSPAPRAARSCT